MPKSIVGLEVSPSAVRAATLRVSKQGMSLEAIDEAPLPPGIMTPTGVSDAPALTAALRQLWASHKIKAKNVVLGVSGQRVVVRNTVVPWLPEKELRAALPLHIGDVLPFDASEAVADFVINGEVLDAEGNRDYAGVLVAASEETVSALVDAVQEAKLTVASVDLTAFAVMRAIVPPVPPGYQVTEAIVNIGTQSTQVIVHTNGRPDLVRDLVFGSDAAVEQFNRLDPNNPMSGPQALEPLVDEISATLGFYQASDGSHPLHRVLLTGEGSLLPGLDFALGAAMALPVARDATWLGMPRLGAALTDEVLRSVAMRMAGPVGLAMGVAA